MYRKAMLICDDVRTDANGAVTLVGVHGERLFAPPGNGPLMVPRLRFVTMIGGLRGHDRLAFRHWLHAEGTPDQEPIGEPGEVAHDPASDEHNFVVGDDPMWFPGAGRYEVVTEVEAGTEVVRFGYFFEIVRAAEPAR